MNPSDNLVFGSTELKFAQQVYNALRNKSKFVALKNMRELLYIYFGDYLLNEPQIKRVHFGADCYQVDNICDLMLIVQNRNPKSKDPYERTGIIPTNYYDPREYYQVGYKVLPIVTRCLPLKVETHHYMHVKALFDALSNDVMQAWDKAASLWLEKYQNLETAPITPKRRPSHSDVEGVTLLRVAMMMSDDDENAAKSTRKDWRNKTSPKLPMSIGVSSDDSRIHIYEPSEIVDFLIKINEVPQKEKSLFVKRLQNRMVNGIKK